MDHLVRKQVEVVREDLKDWQLGPYKMFPPVAKVAQDAQQLLTQISVTLDHDKKREAENESLRAENLALHKLNSENAAYILAHNAHANHAQSNQTVGIFKGLLGGRKKPQLVPMHLASLPPPPAHNTYNIKNLTNARQAVGRMDVDVGVGDSATGLIIRNAKPLLGGVAHFNDLRRKLKRGSTGSDPIDAQ
jgi:hypothetical protein